MDHSSDKFVKLNLVAERSSTGTSFHFLVYDESFRFSSCSELATSHELSDTWFAGICERCHRQRRIIISVAVFGIPERASWSTDQGRRSLEEEEESDKYAVVGCDFCL